MSEQVETREFMRTLPHSHQGCGDCLETQETGMVVHDLSMVSSRIVLTHLFRALNNSQAEMGCSNCKAAIQIMNLMDMAHKVNRQSQADSAFDRLFG